MSRWDNRKKYNEITLCASNPRHVTTNEARVWGFSTSRDSWMQILRKWRVRRALCIIHLSHIRSVLFFVLFPILPSILFAFVLFVTLLCSSPCGLTFNSSRILICTIYFDIYDLINVTSHYNDLCFLPLLNLRRTPYYKLFRTAQFKSIACNFALRSFVLSTLKVASRWKYRRSSANRFSSWTLINYSIITPERTVSK